MMKIREILEEYRGKYEEVEIYKYTGKRHDIHGDFIEDIWCLDGDYSYSIDDLLNVETVDYELMDEQEYNSSVLANTSEYIKFDDIFTIKDAKILVIMLDEFFDVDNRIFFFYYWTGEPFMSEREYFEDGEGNKVFIRSSSQKEALRELLELVDYEYEELASKCWAEEVNENEMNNFRYEDSVEWDSAGW